MITWEYLKFSVQNKILRWFFGDDRLRIRNVISYFRKKKDYFVIKSITSKLLL